MKLYGLTIFISAVLLFQVQLIIAKYILPWFGGTPAVWSTCMLFFQVLLTGGYAYSHGIVSKFTPRRQSNIHISLLGASILLL
ncbi:ferrichrome ABC transporter permease, partial [Thermodesulfobacteriota bacterium]